MSELLLEARDLVRHYPGRKGFVGGGRHGMVNAVDGVDLRLFAGKTLGLAGESGSGKSTIARMLLLIEPLTSGRLTFDGQDVDSFRRRDLRRYRAAVQAVFQDPFSSLNPRMRIWEIVAEPLLVTRALSRSEIHRRAEALLNLVGLRSTDASAFPHEFSGGQRQRIAIARALSRDPALIVLDEPVSALDVSIRAQILNLLRDLQQTRGLAYLLIAHDLAVMRHMCDRIAILYLGKLMEVADSEAIYRKPHHPYTQALLASVLPGRPGQAIPAAGIQGEIPRALTPPTGCRFHTRCPHVAAVCREREPILKPVAADHYVSCHLF
jgi:oligopeptide/dipeptide ABC transporter ATP-binding protein